MAGVIPVSPRCLSAIPYLSFLCYRPISWVRFLFLCPPAAVPPSRARLLRFSLNRDSCERVSQTSTTAMRSSLKSDTVKDANSEAQLRPTRSRYASNAALNKGLSPRLFRSAARFNCTWRWTFPLPSMSVSGSGSEAPPTSPSFTPVLLRIIVQIVSL
jgi:hypothetical protein